MVARYRMRRGGGGVDINTHTLAPCTVVMGKASAGEETGTWCGVGALAAGVRGGSSGVGVRWRVRRVVVTSTHTVAMVLAGCTVAVGKTYTGYIPVWGVG